MKKIVFTILFIVLLLPLAFQTTPLEVLKLKTFDAFLPKQQPSGYFTILNITEEDITFIQTDFSTDTN